MKKLIAVIALGIAALATNAHAEGGCSFTITFATPPTGIAFSVATVAQKNGTGWMAVYTPGTYALPWSDAIVDVSWTKCPCNTVGNQGATCFSVQSSYCLFPPAMAGKIAKMPDGFWAYSWEVTDQCAQGCPIAIGIGPDGGYQCNGCQGCPPCVNVQ